MSVLHKHFWTISSISRMFKQIVIFIFALGLGVRSSIVTPPACDNIGGGSSIQILTYVTNLTLSWTTLDALQPYNLSAGATYNVTFGFIPTSTTTSVVFNVTAYMTVNGVPQQQQIASASVPPFSETTVAKALSYCPFSLVLQLLLVCPVQSLTQLLNMNLLGVLNCAGDTLANQVLQLVPSQASATVLIDVPTLANGSVIFQGAVGDYLGNIVACKQGIINIITQ